MTTALLSKCVIGGRNIRYFNISDFVIEGKPNICSVVNELHLYLASDVLHGCISDTKNMARIHARYGKEGLAVKVKFKDCRVLGISHNKSLWFYNIQAVYKVVFDLGDNVMQRDILVKLQEVWFRQSNNKFDEPELILSSHLDTPTIKSIMSLPVSESDSLETFLTDNATQRQGHDLSQIQSINKNKKIRRNSSSDVNLQTHGTKSEESTSTWKKDLMFKSDVFNNLNACISKSSPNTNEEETIVLNMVLRILHLYETPSCDGIQLITNILDSILAAYENEEILDDLSTNCSLPTRKHIVLCLLGDLLGCELHSLRCDVEHRVESFKQQHIDHIDSLPRPLDLVPALFPHCMIVILRCWMLGDEEDEGRFFSGGKLKRSRYMRCEGLPAYKDRNGGIDPKITLDGNNAERRLNRIINYYRSSDAYIKKKKSSSQGQDVFPFLQLILEFLNNSLISGVAHVLNTRLLQDNV